MSIFTSKDVKRLLHTEFKINPKDIRVIDLGRIHVRVPNWMDSNNLLQALKKKWPGVLFTVQTNAGTTSNAY